MKILFNLLFVYTSVIDAFPISPDTEPANFERFFELTDPSDELDESGFDVSLIESDFFDEQQSSASEEPWSAFPSKISTHNVNTTLAHIEEHSDKIIALSKELATLVKVENPAKKYRIMADRSTSSSLIGKGGNAVVYRVQEKSHSSHQSVRTPTVTLHSSFFFFTIVCGQEDNFESIQKLPACHY